MVSKSKVVALMTIIIFHDINDGDLVTNRLVTVGDKSYYIGTYNKVIKGATVIDGIEYYF